MTDTTSTTSTTSTTDQDVPRVTDAERREAIAIASVAVAERGANGEHRVTLF